MAPFWESSLFIIFCFSFSVGGSKNDYNDKQNSDGDENPLPRAHGVRILFSPSEVAVSEVSGELSPLLLVEGNLTGTIRAIVLNDCCHPCFHFHRLFRSVRQRYRFAHPPKRPFRWKTEQTLKAQRKEQDRTENKKSLFDFFIMQTL